jgi:hypothetical protein
MPTPQVRVVGSSYSTFNYNGKAIAYLEGVEDSGQRPFSDAGAAWQPIHPLGNQHPTEIAVSRVLQAGTLNLTIRELWAAPVWNQLAGLAGTYNILDVFAVLANNPAYVTCQTIIRPPGAGAKPRGKVYHNCTVVDISDNDTITVGALAVTKGIVVAYTHSTKL